VNDDNGINIDDLNLKPRSLAFIRTQIKEAEKNFEYWSRCYKYLDMKTPLAEAQEEEKQRILKRLQKFNKLVADLWTDEQIAADMEKARSEGRSYLPIAKNKPPDEKEARC
jgi:hypothetical protein